MTEASRIDFTAKLNRNPHTGSIGKFDEGFTRPFSCATARKSGKLLYWDGSLQETVNLARTISFKCEADRFRVIELTDSGAEMRLEEAVSLNNR